MGRRGSPPQRTSTSGASVGAFTTTTWVSQVALSRRSPGLSSMGFLRGRGGSGVDGDRGGACDVAHVDVANGVEVDGQRGPTAVQLGERDLAFEAGEVGADAVVDAV